VRDPSRAEEAAQDISALRPDAGAVVAYGQILPSAILSLFPLGMVNLHFSLLPRWRGAAPVEHAILAGDNTTGVSTMVLDKGMDTGPLLRQVEVSIHPEERAAELTARLAALGAPVLTDSLEALASGSIEPLAQDDEQATLAPKLRTDDAKLRWSDSADSVVRRARACYPRPGAFTMWRGRRLEIVKASVGEEHGGVAPGSLRAGPLRAAASDRWVVLHEVHAEGRHPVTGEEFTSGARLRPDDVVG
jgi:methionyl-tRNA formyltransferase